MGDNRPNSGDSRFLGPQPISAIKGRAFWTYWPLSRFGPLK
jgi:signal peptidase I